MNKLPVPSPSPTYHGMQADKTCDFLGVLELCSGGEIHSPGCTAHPLG